MNDMIGVKSKWTITDEDFVALLRTRWSEVTSRFEVNEDSQSLCWWLVVLPGGFVEGALFQNGQAIFLDGD